MFVERYTPTFISLEHERALGQSLERAIACADGGAAALVGSSEHSDSSLQKVLNNTVL